ncbi:xanthine permease [Allostella sp. ATCC 35155]|nr:xanthine permease [Stella sp. ATCC 35155]
MERTSQLLVHGRDDRLPLHRLFGLALQHLILLLMFLVYPVMVGRGLGLTDGAEIPFLTMALLCIGLGTILQSLPGPWGSGHLHVHQPSPIFLPLALQTLPFGGLAALAPMIVVAGAAQLLLAHGLYWLRRCFPPEVIGVVVLLLGLSLVPGALERCLEAGARAALDQCLVLDGALENCLEKVVHGAPTTAPLVAGLTLATMVGIAVYGRGPLRLFSLILGAIVGVALAALLGLFAPGDLQRLADTPFFALPVPRFDGWIFNWSLLPLALLIACVHLLDSLGAHVGAQKLADADWQRTDAGTAGLAMRAVGAGNVLAGLLGGYPAGVSSSSVGLTFTTGAVAWRVGVLTGILGVVCAFIPKIAMFLAILPEPVVGAIVLNAAAFMIAAGMELIFSRMLNTRRIFMVGLSVIAGLAALLRPELAVAAPDWIRPVMASPLFVGSAVAVGLNLLFRLGISEEERLPLRADDPLPIRLRDFFERKGQQWGLRRSLVDHAQLGTMQAVETLFQSGILREPEVEVSLRYDELHLDVLIAYDGEALPVGSPRPSPDELLEDDSALLRMTAHIVAGLADGCRIREEAGRVRLELRFDS